MTRESENLHPRAIWLTGLGIVIVTLIVAAISWALLVSPPATRTAAPSTLLHDLFGAPQ